MRRRANGSATLALVLLLSACTPLYLPPVPEPVELAERHEVDGVALLNAGRPALRLELVRVIEPVWLAVQWFSPANVEAASESVWITPADEGSTVALVLPDDTEAVPGRWRAVVSADGRVLRQLSVTVP